jgi:hypothetical protein
MMMAMMYFLRIILKEGIPLLAKFVKIIQLQSYVTSTTVTCKMTIWRNL